MAEQLYDRFSQYIEPLGFEGARDKMPRLLSFSEIVDIPDEKRERAAAKWMDRMDLEERGKGKMTFINGKAVERTDVS